MPNPNLPNNNSEEVVESTEWDVLTEPAATPEKLPDAEVGAYMEQIMGTAGNGPEAESAPETQPVEMPSEQENQPVEAPNEPTPEIANAPVAEVTTEAVTETAADTAQPAEAPASDVSAEPNAEA